MTVQSQITDDGTYSILCSTAIANPAVGDVVVVNPASVFIEAPTGTYGVINHVSDATHAMVAIGGTCDVMFKSGTTATTGQVAYYGGSRRVIGADITSPAWYGSAVGICLENVDATAGATLGKIAIIGFAQQLWHEEIAAITETDPVFVASPASAIAGGDIINWNTAYAWGDHSVAGYLTTELDTLDAVAGRGATTTTALTTGALTVNSALADADTSIGGDTDAALFYVDAGNDRIGIGDSTPSHKLDVNGYIAMQKRYDPDLPPETANAVDDEFDDGAVAAKWTWVVHGGGAGTPGTYNETTYPGFLFMQNANTAETYFAHQTVAYGTNDFTLVLKMQSSSLSANAQGAGIFVADVNGQNGLSIQWRQGGTTYNNYGTFSYTSWAGVTYPDCMSSITAAKQVIYGAFPLYLKFKRVSNTAFLYGSKDGMSWELQNAGLAYATNVERIGFVVAFGAMYVTDTDDNPNTVILDFFRKTA